MDDNKAKKVAKLAGISVEEVMEFALADWDEGKEHQTWLDNASAQEIADWIVSGHS